MSISICTFIFIQHKHHSTFYFSSYISFINFSPNVYPLIYNFCVQTLFQKHKYRNKCIDIYDVLKDDSSLEYTQCIGHINMHIWIYTWKTLVQQSVYSKHESNLRDKKLMLTRLKNSKAISITTLSNKLCFENFLTYQDKFPTS